MIPTHTYPIRCPVCGFHGAYKATGMGIATEFHCPHCGTPVDVMPEVAPGTEGATYSSTSEEFAAQLKDYAAGKIFSR